MAATGKRQDPLIVFRFEIRIDDLSVGGFSECTGLQLETEIHDHSEGGLNSHVLRFPTRTKQSNITLKRGIVDRAMWDWYYDLTQGVVRHRNITVSVYDPSGATPVAEWDVMDAFPQKWVGPELNASQSNVAVETVELCHHGLERRP